MRTKIDDQDKQNFRADRTLLCGGTHLSNKADVNQSSEISIDRKTAVQIVRKTVLKADPPFEEVAQEERRGDPKQDSQQAKP